MKVETVSKANGFLKDLGIMTNLRSNPQFTHKGVVFEYVENAEGVGKLFFDGTAVFGGNTYTNMAVFDGGSAVKIYDADGNRSTKANFKSDLKKAAR